MNADWIFAADAEEPDDGTDLLFLLAPDERAVTVRRIRAPNPADEPTKTSAHTDWVIESASFGPRAWFDLDCREYAANPDQRYLVVREVSYGRHDRSTTDRQLYITFDFKRTALAKDEKKPEEGAVNAWTIGFTTNIWPGKGTSESFGTEVHNRKRLHQFISARSKDQLVETLSANRINTALTPMFDTQVRALDQMVVGLDANAVWHFQAVSNELLPLSAFDGSVRGPAGGEEATVRWVDLAGPEAGNRGRRLVAEYKADWTGDFAFGAANGTISGDVTPSSLAKAERPVGALFVGQLEPLSSAVTQGGRETDSIVALLSWPVATLSCTPSSNNNTSASGVGGKKPGKVPQPSCTDLALHDVKMSRIRLGGTEDGFWRNVIVADAAGSRRVGAPKAKEDVKAGNSPAKADPVETLILPPTIQTAIGRLEVAPLPLEARPDDQKEVDEGEEKRLLFDAATAAAIGDRSGVADRSFFLLADRQAAASKKSSLPQVRRLYADVALQSIDTALPGTSDSALTFAGSHFRLIYADGQNLPELVTPEAAWATPDGFLWLGTAEWKTEAAAIDLGGATLFARRDDDLVDLRFRFSDFTLAFAAGEDALAGVTAPLLRPARDDCRVLVHDGQVTDSRPILSVEFSPQHVMEETFFRPDPEPLPDTEWPKNADFPDLASFLAALDNEVSEEKRVAMRKKLGKAKADLEKVAGGNSKFNMRAVEYPFGSLRVELAGSSAEGLSQEQKQYIGPYAMSSVAIRAARKWQAEKVRAWFMGADGQPGLVNAMIIVAAKVGTQPKTNWTLEELLSAERDAEKVYPLYKLWRDAFRAYVIEQDAVSDPANTEFVNKSRTPPPDPSLLPADETVEEFKKRFVKTISGQDSFDRLATARLSRRSRLSFRINCEPAPGDSSETNGLPAFSVDKSAAPGPGVQRFGSMKFSFDELTNWSRHEPYVTQRARKLYQPLSSGALPPVAGRVASIDDHAILESQDFVPGAKQAEAHLNQVRASLQKHPAGLETEIEIPARIILSTAQDAIWQTSRKVDRGLVAVEPSSIFETDPENKRPGVEFSTYEPLWSARLLAREAEPSLRAIWSPDVRPEAIGFVAFGSLGAPRITGAPPRGPWAPWVLRREQVDGVWVSPQDVATASGQAVDPKTPIDDICTIPKARPKRPTMFERVCEIFRVRALYENPELHMFRSSLDAYDRHELVLLSSAYGLPVTGKRRQIDNDEKIGGELVERSGQFEPGEDFHLTDATPDLAYYRPKPLDVTELSLTALGGFLTHDTNFQPPAPALTYDGRSMFDGLSIERWQHQVVLGRDVLATVVYSGYLLPLGHKASLVKLTERIFVRVGPIDSSLAKADDKIGLGIKAVLRQRMFVRVSSPAKKYPAVGQPNHGRQWCAEDVTMLTRQTPDIVDPTFELEVPVGKESLSGRIYLDGAPGLAFWPQTAMTEEARIRFEFLVDGRRTRLPLIFADRIAAKNPTALAALNRYYIGIDADKWRKAAFGGQTLRFAEPQKDGDTSFAAESIVLSVEGRGNDDGSWAGANNVVSNTGVLEGADQPPFYPVMFKANIRIEQAERMSGASMPATPVRFDGHYVKYGFDSPVKQESGADKSKSVTIVGNAAQLFLYVDTSEPPELRMGPNGNQSGGVGRPDMRIVGLSRSKGIIGAGKDVAVYRRAPNANPITYPADGNGQALLSVAGFFSLPSLSAMNATGGHDSGQSPPEPADYTTVFNSFFSVDAKLLGVISFQSLMKLLKLVGGVDAMPALQEAVDYGSQALAKLEGGAADVMDLLRTEILAPLLSVVRSARNEWSKLDGRATDGQNNLIKEIKSVFTGLKAESFRDLYPEIDRGLNALEAAIVKALAETDPLKMMAQLAAVHEAGRQFMRELSRLAANPIERIEQAAEAQFSVAADELRNKIRRYEDAAKNVAGALKQAILTEAKALGNRLVAYIFDWLQADDIALLLDTMAAVPDLQDLVKRVRDGLTAIDVDLSPILRRLVDDPPIEPRDALIQTSNLIFASADKAAEDNAKNELSDGLFDGQTIKTAKGELKSAIDAYRTSLQTANDKVAEWLGGRQPTPRWAPWVARVKRIEHLLALLRELAASDSPPRAFAIIAELGRDYLGVDLAAYKTLIEERLKAEQRKLTDWVDAILRRLSELGQDSANVTTIEPKLPPGVFQACLAKTPVNTDPPIDARKIAKDLAASFPNTPEHWLKPFAASMAETFEIEPTLETIISSTLPQNARNAASALEGQLPIYRDLFCEVAVIVGRAEKVHAELTAAMQRLNTGGDPGVVPAELLKRLEALGQEIATGLQNIQDLLEGVVTKLSPHAPVIAGAAAAALAANLITQDQKDRFDEWQASAANGLLTGFNALFRLAGVAAGATQATGAAALSSLSQGVRDILPLDLDPERGDFASALDGLSGASAALAEKIGAYRIIPASKLTTLQDLFDTKLESTTVGQALVAGGIARTDAIQAAVERVNHTYDGLVTRLIKLPQRVADVALDSPVKTLLGAVLTTYVEIRDLRTKLLKATETFVVAGPAIRNALLVAPLATVCVPLSESCDKLHEELAAVDQLAKSDKPVSGDRPALQAFAASIAGGRSAVETILLNFQHLWDDIARGDIAALVDIAALRDEVEDLVSQLIPVKRTLRYSLGYDFDADKIGSATGGVFQPKVPGRFELDMTATIDLIKQRAEMKAVGHIGAFDIKLIGSIFDAVTLMFDGIDFSYEAGGSPRFDVHYRDFKIGTKLKFIEQLQSYLTPSGDGSGFFIETTRDRPGITAGYGLNLGTIQLGGITFSNVLLAAAAELPFDGGAAIFRFSLGRAMAPFLISVPPFGGGGFVAIYADAQGFIGFEASMEFGGVADFSAGPLVAVGRLTSGFYIRSMKVTVDNKTQTLTDISGTFFVGGSASIWIFDFYASLYVRLGMKSGGGMEGIAIFTFSFSMGIVDYDFSVAVKKQQSALGGSGTQSIRRADIPADVDTSIITRGTPPDVPNVVAETVSLSSNTLDSFLAYFDLSLARTEPAK